MTIRKSCADFLRQEYLGRTGERLRSGHAHELVAAFFGYRDAASLRAEAKYPVDNVANADIIVPDYAMIERRITEIEGLPHDLGTCDEIVDRLVGHLEQAEGFGGSVWYTQDISEFIASDYLYNDPMLIEDGLSSEMADTNAYFDELYVEEVDLGVTADGMYATVTGSLNGDSDQDKPFSGDKINFSSVMTFDRAAGRTGFFKPAIETSGSVDDSWYEVEP